MTDRELLEMAARAAGMHAVEWADPGTINDKGGFVQFIGLGRVDTWHPLNDDADALRLLVALGMSINTGRKGTVCAKAKHKSAWWIHERIEDHDDLASATRRAIVHAATQIGGKQ